MLSTTAWAGGSTQRPTTSLSFSANLGSFESLKVRLPLPHHKHLKSTNMLERLNQELKRRTHVVRIFPNAESCLRLVRALAAETHEDWLEATSYLNMEHLKEHKKEQLRALAA